MGKTLPSPAVPGSDEPALIDFGMVARLCSLSSPGAARKMVYRFAPEAVRRLGRRCVRIDRRALLAGLEKLGRKS